MRVTCAVVLSILSSAAAAGEQKIVLKEHLGVAWKREWVSYPVSFPKGDCHAESVRLRMGRRPVACQLSDVTLWPGGSHVKDATVSFVTDLAPLATNTCTLSFGPSAVSAGQPKTDLHVSRQADTVEITTRHIGARLRLGRKAGSGPLEALRTADGKWFGGSRFAGKARIKNTRATVLAEGPVFAAVQYRFTFADGNVMELLVRVLAGDNAVLWDTDVKKHASGYGLELDLSKGLPPLVFRVMRESNTKRPQFKGNKTAQNQWADLPLAQHAPGLVTKLTPWADWWDDYTQTTIVLKRSDIKGELRIRRRDAGAWVKPEPGGKPPKVSWGQKLVPLVLDKDRQLLMQVDAAGGVRRWSFIDYTPERKQGKDWRDDPNARFTTARHYVERHSLVGRRLNVVKDFVLEWDSKPGRKHPFMLMTQKELEAVWARGIVDKDLMKKWWANRDYVKPEPNSTDATSLAAYLMTGSRKVAKDFHLVERFKKNMAVLGQFSIRGRTSLVTYVYDALIDSDLVDPKDRPMLRAQMAYVGYKATDPAVWSVQRRYMTGNPNMSTAHLLALGTVGCLLPDHPESGRWVKAAFDYMDSDLAQVGPKGSYYESFHYTDVSTRPMLMLAIAARNAGIRDYFKEGTMMKIGRFRATFYTPRDPQRGNWRCAPPLGRSWSGDRYGSAGVWARATATSDPDFSKLMQWTWKEIGYSKRHLWSFMCGWEHVYLDKTLPAERPDFQTDLFPRVGAVLRRDVGTPHEYYLAMFTTDKCRFVRTFEPGSILKLFAKGKPIGGAFMGSYRERHELLMSRVSLARKRIADNKPHWYGYYNDTRLAGFAATPRLDYVAVTSKLTKPWAHGQLGPPVPPELREWMDAKRDGKPPLNWRR